MTEERLQEEIRACLNSPQRVFDPYPQAVQELLDEVFRLRTENADLKKYAADLETRLGRDGLMANKPECSTLIDLREATAALKQLDDLEEIVDVPPERGGVHFSDWERAFIKSVREQFDRTLTFSQAQRDKIAEIWHLVDLRKRGAPEEKPANLFSKLSPERQAEQRARASKVKLPWE